MVVHRSETAVVALSVVIPTFNRAHRLHACLSALARQRGVADEWEVIVVNDGSTDETETVLAQIETPLNLRVIHQARGGQTRSLNCGAAAAAAPFLLFLDDDVRACPTLIAAHLRAQQQRGGIIGIGPLTNPAGGNSFSRHFALQWREHYLHLEQGRAPTWRDCYSGNLSLPRDAFIETGGFATDLPTCFDLELGYRLAQRSIHIMVVPDACGEHDDPKDARRLLQGIEAEGRITPEFHRRHPELLRTLYGSYWRTTSRAASLRQALLRLNVPPPTLLRIEKSLPLQFRANARHRFLSDYAFWRGVRSAVSADDWARLVSRTPILMYHAFGAPGETPSRFVLPIDRFEQQLQWLRDHDYNLIRLDDYLDGLQNGVPPPARSVILTLDDGYVDNLNLAFPVLQRYEAPVTMFVVSGRVGGTNDWDHTSELRGRALLDWEQLSALAAAGVGIGAHTRTHPHLRETSQDQVCAEIAGSRSDLVQRLGVPVQVFAYPYGELNEHIQNAAEQSGFLGSCTVRRGLNALGTLPHALFRTEIFGTDSLRQFVSKLQHG